MSAVRKFRPLERGEAVLVTRKMGDFNDQFAYVDEDDAFHWWYLGGPWRRAEWERWRGDFDALRRGWLTDKGFIVHRFSLRTGEAIK